jgi:hypothetical protein
MKEELLWYLWKFKLFNNNLHLKSGEKLTILKPGIQNHDSGPDFFNALIKINETTWAGNVEMHVKSSDWYLHGHDKDKAYNNVILHVVFKHDKDVLGKNGEPLPVLEAENNFDIKILNRYEDYIKGLRKIPCENDIDKTDYFTTINWLERLTFERLEQKAGNILNQTEDLKYDFHEAFYRKIARYFGLKANNDAFEMLAKSLPLKILTVHNENLLQLEALLYGQAGMLSSKYQDEYPQVLLEEYRFLASKYNLKPIDKSVWRFMRMRPANFPTVRISQFANLFYRTSGMLHKIFTEKNLNNIKNLFSVNASEYWDKHYRFDIPSQNKKRKIFGNTSIDILLINAVVPFVFAYGIIQNKPELKEKAVDWLEQIKAENNKFTRLYAGFGIKAENAMQSQAMVQLKTEYCDKKRCLNCAIGHYLLKRNE